VQVRFDQPGDHGVAGAVDDLPGVVAGRVRRSDRHDPPVLDGDVDRRVTAGHPRVAQ
jgi:hypothetical protein